MSGIGNTTTNIQTLRRAIDAAERQALAPHVLTVAGFELLDLLSRDPGISAVWAAARIGVSAQSTGVPVTRATYLEYPDQQDAYAFDGSEYFYGPDVLVAPATSGGDSATTQVWFPAGSSWTDYFTGKTYQGGTVQNVTTGLDTMPVFVKSGGIMATRTGDVANDDQNPLTQATATVAEGAPGAFTLYEDNGTTTNTAQSATTDIHYANHHVIIDPAKGTFTGQVRQRAWTVRFENAQQPTSVSINGASVTADKWTWDSASHVLTVKAPTQSVSQPLVVSYK